MPPRVSAVDDIERRFLADAVELRVDGDDKAPRLVGWAPIWNSLSVDLGGFQERVQRGATRKTVKEQDIPLLVNHDGLPLASSGGGSMSLTEDDRGLRFETELDPGDPDVQRLIPKMRRGDMRKTSFGFLPIKESWDNSGKMPVRTLTEIKLFDVSIVYRPAYPQSEVKLRSLMAGAGVDVDAFPRVMLRVQRGQPLQGEDVELLEQVSAYLRSLIPAQTAEAAEPTEPDEVHSETPQQQSEPAQSGHSLAETRRLLDRIEAQLER